MQFLASLWFAVWLLNTKSCFIARGLMSVGRSLAAGDGFRVRLFGKTKRCSGAGEGLSSAPHESPTLLLAAESLLMLSQDCLVVLPPFSC